MHMATAKPLLILVLLLLFGAITGEAADSLTVLEQQLSQQISRENDMAAQIKKMEQEIRELAIAIPLLRNKREADNNAYNKARDTYLRMTQNPDLVTPEQLSRALQQYQAADAALRQAEEEIAQAEAGKRLKEQTLPGLAYELSKTNVAILETKAAIFDIKAAQDVWVEGFGEAILDENKTMKECEKLALEYARRDALERGGKAMLEALTVVDMQQVVKDTVKVSASVQIIEQDNSGDYGRVVKHLSGDFIKFTVKIRVKVRSTDQAVNPFKQQAEEMKALLRKPPDNPPELKPSLTTEPQTAVKPTDFGQEPAGRAGEQSELAQDVTGTWIIRSVKQSFPYIDYAKLKIKQSGGKITGIMEFPEGIKVDVAGVIDKQYLDLTIVYNNEKAIMDILSDMRGVYSVSAPWELKGISAKMKLKLESRTMMEGEFSMWYASIVGYNTIGSHYHGGTPGALKMNPPKAIKVTRMMED